MGIERGDIVVRISYGKDIYFKVVAVDSKKQTASLKGLDIRLCADAPLADLEKPGIGDLANYRAKALKVRVEKVNRAARRQKLSTPNLSRGNRKPGPEYLEVPGRILHIDGDYEYMEVCQRAYKDLALDAYTVHITESEQPEQAMALLREVRPDIVVFTGHDGMVKNPRRPDNLENYHNSRHFIAAVAQARRYQAAKDDLVIFAGACQSFYPGLIKAGANFASSPDRVLIHCLDPVLIVEKLAYTPITKTINIHEVLSESITGIKGVGGIETRGQYRLGLPRVRDK